MKTTSSLICLALLSLPLVSQVSAPKVGTVRYADGSLHSVQGVPQNMIVCDLPLDSADAASFSDQGGIVSHQGVIQLLNPDFSVVFEYKTGEAAALVNMEGDLTSALAWLPSKHLLLRWDGQKFLEAELADSDLPGKVTNLQAVNSKLARLLVIAADGSVSGVTFSNRNGSLIAAENLVGVRGYAFSQSFFFIFSNEKELVVDSLRGYRRSIALPAPDLLIERMSSQWLHLSSASLKQDWALHLTQAELQLSMLPGVVPRKGSATVAAALGTASGEPK